MAGKTTKRAKTLIERQGFMDPDRKNSSHDDICFWVDDNIEDVIAALGVVGERPIMDSKKEGIQALKHKRDYLLDKTFWPIAVGSTTFEEAIVEKNYNGNIFNVGFHDLTVHFGEEDVYLSETKSCGEVTKEWNWTYDLSHKLFAEVKTKIGSVGDVIREVNFYRSHIKDQKSVHLVVCPDVPKNKYKRLLSQGIWYLDSNSETMYTPSGGINSLATPELFR